MKEKLQYGIYLIPLLLSGIVESLIQMLELDVSRSQIYVPLLALFPFLYLVQGILISQYGGNLLFASIITSEVYLSTAGVFLNFISVSLLGMLNLIVFCLIFMIAFFQPKTKK